MAATKQVTFTNLELFAETPKAGFIFLQLTRFNALVLPPSVAYNSNQNFKKLKALNETYSETRKKLIEEKAEKDEQGQPQTKEGQYVFASEAVEKEVIAAVEELDNTTVTVDLIPIKLSAIENVQGVTGHMIGAMEKFIDA